MVEVVCEKCGKQYELPKGENIDSYICSQCDGNLKYLNNDVQFSENIDLNFNRNKESNFVSDGSYLEKKISRYKIVMIIGSIISIIGIIVLFFNEYNIYILIIGIIIFNFGYKEYRNWYKGSEGEELVARYLNELSNEYFIFHDVNLPNGRGNIDHVVIGPNGIFAIETKNLSGSYSVEDDQWFYTGNRKYQRSKSQPGKQIKSNAMILLNYLKSNGVYTTNLWIHSIVAFNNPKLSIKERPRHYDIISPSKIPEFIKSRRKPIKIDKITEMVKLITPYAHKSSY